MAAPTFLDFDQDPATNGGSGTSVVFDWGSITGEADDDVALCAIYKESTAAYTATPTDWAQVSGFPVDQDTGGFKYRTDLWWRRRAGDAGTATWSWSGSTWRYSEMAVYQGAYTGDDPPIPTLTADEETAQNTSPVHPGITIARTDSGLVWIVYNFSDISNTTPPTGHTHRLEALSGNRNIVWYDDLSTTPGATGTISATLAGDIEWPLTVALELATEAGGAAAATSRPVFPRTLRVWRGRRVK